MGGWLQSQALGLLLITTPLGMVTMFPTPQMRGLRPDSQTQELNFYTFLGPRPQRHLPPCW